MTYEFKVVRYLNRARSAAKIKKEETGIISGPDAFSMAHVQAMYWANKPDSKGVQMLRADKEGINAGKFFLHLIVKP